MLKEGLLELAAIRPSNLFITPGGEGWLAMQCQHVPYSHARRQPASCLWVLWEVTGLSVRRAQVDCLATRHLAGVATKLAAPSISGVQATPDGFATHCHVMGREASCLVEGCPVSAGQQAGGHAFWQGPLRVGGSFCTPHVRSAACQPSEGVRFM